MAFPARQKGYGMEHDILTIDGDPIMTQILIEQLAPLTRPRVAANASEAMKQIARRVPDLILLDTELPGTHGIDLCRALHSDARLAHVPIIFLTAQTGESFEIEGLESGAVDFISKPPRGAVLRARVKTQLELARLTRELELLNLTDPLTGLINRRRYDEVLHNELARARRSREPLSLILVDLDDFKLFNDQYGHGAGDECLCKVAQLLQTCARRPADAVARIGGEELALILPHTPAAGGMEVAQTILTALEDAALPHLRSRVADHVTVSLGLACLEPSSDIDTETTVAAIARDLGERAAQALSEAKDSGRARFVYRSGRRRPVPTPETSPEKNAPWPEIKGIDNELSHQRLCGNRELFITLVSKLLDQFEDLVEPRKYADMEEDEATLHFARRLFKLKGSADTLGATHLQSLAAGAETALRQADDAQIALLVRTIHEHMDEMRASCEALSPLPFQIPSTPTAFPLRATAAGNNIARP